MARYEVVDYNGKVLHTSAKEEYAHIYWVQNKNAYDVRIKETKAEPVAVVFWWRQDEVHHGWYGNKEFATLAEARAQYETWTAEGKLANYVAL